MDYSAPVIDAVDRALSAPLLDMVVPEGILEQALKSARQYKDHPGSYISRAIDPAAQFVTENKNPMTTRPASENAKMTGYL